MKLAEQLSNDPNWDEATQNQEKAIEEEIAAQQPLVSKLLAVVDLQPEYIASNNSIYLLKAQKLAELYTKMRRVRGDGCCFYRALAFLLSERLVQNGSFKESFLKSVATFKTRLFKLGYPEMTTEDFCDVFLETVSDFQSEDQVVETFNDQGRSNYLVVFMRLVTCCYLLENEAKFADFVEGGRTLREYCKDEVEPMSKECDHLCITALTEALNVALRIEYMDQSLSPGNMTHHDFNLGDNKKEAEIFFLYRPGHYDILYKK